MIINLQEDKDNKLYDVLSKSEPFSYLSNDEIKYFLDKASIKKYKKGELLVGKGEQVEKVVRLVVEGSAKVFVIAETGDEVVIDYRSVGDIIGLLSIATEDVSLVNVVVVDDIICYELDKKDLYHLFFLNNRFLDGFLTIYVKKYLTKFSVEFKENALYYGSIDRMFFTSLVSYVTRIDYPKITKGKSIVEAAKIMVDKDYSAVVVVDNGVPSGIITDKDFRKKIISKSVDYDTEVDKIMSFPVHTIESDSTCFEAIIRMIALNVNHLVVMDGQDIFGIIDSESLMNLQSSSPLAFAKEIELKEDIEDLSTVATKVINISATMYRNGLRAENITKIVSELNDRLLRRILDIGIARFGEPPVSFCWIAMGSEGRKEQTFKTDQDNGLIYKDIPEGIDKQRVVGYFKDLSEFVNNSLIECGFPPCPGNYMAKNPEWCQPLSVWKKYFDKFFATPTSDAVLKGQIIFDFRGVYGDKNLAYELRNHINLIKNKSLFMNFMAKGLVNYGSPLTFFGSFVTDKMEDGKECFDIKKRILAPLVGIVRLFAIEEGLMSLSTIERINDLVRVRNKVVLDNYRELEQSFNFLLDLRMKNQIYQYISGVDVNNLIFIDDLSGIENRQLKLACQLLEKLQDILKKRYGL
ncbi:MAG: DUF294 nucleotidyltransferase-like domain-containing protein [Calditerrivibrio sp.]|nr:DUF294 nucleotidyltransferase-like domain-containing protein [Calditerrivibrio sp.]